MPHTAVSALVTPRIPRCIPRCSFIAQVASLAPVRPGSNTAPHHTPSISAAGSGTAGALLTQQFLPHDTHGVAEIALHMALQAYGRQTHGSELQAMALSVESARLLEALLPLPAHSLQATSGAASVSSQDSGNLAGHMRNSISPQHQHPLHKQLLPILQSVDELAGLLVSLPDKVPHGMVGCQGLAPSTWLPAVLQHVLCMVGNPVGCSAAVLRYRWQLLYANLPAKSPERKTDFEESCSAQISVERLRDEATAAAAAHACWPVLEEHLQDASQALLAAVLERLCVRGHATIAASTLLAVALGMEVEAQSGSGTMACAAEHSSRAVPFDHWSAAKEKIRSAAPAASGGTLVLPAIQAALSQMSEEAPQVGG